MTRHGRRIKRCGTCIERKVKCDEQQPHCQRCKNAGLPCLGYHSQLKFVDEGSRFASTGECSSKAVSKSTSTTQCNHSTTNRVATKCAKAPKSQILNLVPQKNTFFLPYTISKLSPVTSRCTSTRAVGILPELLTTQKSALHQSCVQALAAMYFGRTNRDIQACEQGTRLYSKALTQLRADISNLNTELSTIISVMCLCVYENVVFSQPTAWLMHYDGLGRLMQSRGPRPWKTREEREVLRFARYYTILSAGHQRRHCFLDQPQWASARCTPEGEKPERIDLLYDIFAQSPGIVEDYDNLRQRTCTSTSETEALRQRVQSVIDRLHTWLQGVPWICIPDPALRDSSSMPLPDDPMDCVAMSVCYAMLLCLVQPCEYLGVALISNHAADLAPNADTASTTKFLALEICRFATWALRGEGSASYALNLVYPLQISWFCLQNNEEDLCSVRGIMNSVVADSHGFELGRMRHWDETSLDQGRYGFLY